MKSFAREKEAEDLAAREAIDAMIAEITLANRGTRRVRFECDIGNTDEAGINWKFLKGGEAKWVYVPRIAFKFERHGPRINRWAVEMAEPAARLFKIEEFVL